MFKQLSKRVSTHLSFIWPPNVIQECSSWPLKKPSIHRDLHAALLGEVVPSSLCPATTTAPWANTAWTDSSAPRKTSVAQKLFACFSSRDIRTSLFFPLASLTKNVIITSVDCTLSICKINKVEIRQHFKGIFLFD